MAKLDDEDETNVIDRRGETPEQVAEENGKALGLAQGRKEGYWTGWLWGMAVAALGVGGRLPPWQGRRKTEPPDRTRQKAKETNSAP
jgi:hypothetical protein